MEDERQELMTVPYVVHESIMARMERINRRLWILCLVIFLVCIGSNSCWIWYESQFEDVVTTEETWQDVDTGEGDATVVGIGDYYGESKADSQKDNENP